MSEFDSARLAGLVRRILGLVRREPAGLLPFDPVRERLRLRRLVDRGVVEVPLEKIVGSVGRERDFTRAFLPREESLRQRWEEIHNLAEGASGFPPVELYKVGEIYFVVDGHHRVSVARSLDAPAIEAHVQEFLTPVPLLEETSIEDLLSKEGLADFLEATGLGPSAAADLRVTEPAGYAKMLEHIGVHRYFLGLEQQQDISWEEAVRSWFETLFLPVVGAIRESGILSSFSGRTEADLYGFAIDHLHWLRERYGERVLPDRAVHHFALQQRASRSARRRIRKLLDRPSPEEDG